MIDDEGNMEDIRVEKLRKLLGRKPVEVDYQYCLEGLRLTIEDYKRREEEFNKSKERVLESLRKTDWVEYKPYRWPELHFFVSPQVLTIDDYLSILGVLEPYRSLSLEYSYFYYLESVYPELVIRIP